MANDKSNSTSTVTVACKLPHGFHLDLHDEQGNILARHTVKGTNQAEVIGGHGITTGVPADFFAEWLRVNAKLPMVRNRLIFADEQSGKVVGEAKEREGNRTGLEGLDGNNPSRAVGVDPNGPNAIKKQDNKG